MTSVSSKVKYYITIKISVDQQRWLRPLRGANLIPPALLVVADYECVYLALGILRHINRSQGGYVMGKKVLVVDDDPDVRLFSVTVLEEHGYTPLEAANGEEGLKMIKEQKPDLIILDVLMPRQSGIRLYRELKTDKSLKNLKIIILSGIAKKTFLRSQKALTEFGGKEVPEPEIYLEKPVEPEELAETIKKFLG